ncbi:MAG: NAD-dependent epimerase/dehydratase family protein [Alphaproteobacteria bacterium]|nr:NAD-dependent epimerase/dehydratase family protein [Alphaproteobacteria bacterium]
MQKPAAAPRGPVQFTDDEIAALMPRPLRRVDQRAARTLIGGKRVLVTGAGGTIGSELARQVSSFEPAMLAILDHSEFNLYQIDMELREAGLGAQLFTTLTDVCRTEHLERVFDIVKPEIVIHAAAFKHVPIVEQNRCAGALTNVLGAKNVFDAAIDAGAETVVFISTDKAVNPSSFMGATKRIAELYAQALDVAQNDTRFVTVRFGNVLGSTGSVVPLFARQIARGGPVTVTHPDIQRFFMTTREAVQLVLQSASLERGNQSIVTHDGRVFVLDMGEPVRILDLAKRMIEWKGLAPGQDIEIRFTGLRPGEKLFEEIFLDTDKLIKTGADGVLLASPAMIDLPLLNPRLTDVIESALSGDQEAVDEAVHHLVPEFSPAREQGPGANQPQHRS